MQAPSARATQTHTVDAFIAETACLPMAFWILSQDEIDLAQSYRSARRRLHYCAGRTLLRHALCHCEGRPPETWQFEVREGRPFLPSLDSPHFSLSHSGGWVGCLVSRFGECGFDIQEHVPRSLQDIANAFFSAADLDWLESQPAYDLGFFQLWTLKEAAAKAMGRPLLNALDKLAFVPQAASAKAFEWSSATASFADKATLACIAKTPEVSWRLWVWDGDGFRPFETPWKRWALAEMYPYK